ncbi:MAG: hypothetical protein HY556_05425 [Euryarchaeota archaeon]|nr:hypothetical protein [Euryarchaeota archaeon]
MADDDFEPTRDSELAKGLFVRDLVKGEIHNIGRLTPACRLPDVPPDKRVYYKDELSATKVLKAAHLVPCLHCYGRGRPLSKP